MFRTNQPANRASVARQSRDMNGSDPIFFHVRLALRSILDGGAIIIGDAPTEVIGLRALHGAAE